MGWMYRFRSLAMINDSAPLPLSLICSRVNDSILFNFSLNDELQEKGGVTRCRLTYQKHFRCIDDNYNSSTSWSGNLVRCQMSPAVSSVYILHNCNSNAYPKSSNLPALYSIWLSAISTQLHGFDIWHQHQKCQLWAPMTRRNFISLVKGTKFNPRACNKLMSDC